jgi:hypothetical protein
MQSAATYCYDSTDAARFIAARTDETQETVNRFLRAHLRYQQLNYLCELGDDATAERELHADLITNSPDDFPKNEDDDKLLLYIRRVTGLGRARVANMIAEENGYMTSIGLMDPAAIYPNSRSWADAISQEEQEAEDARPVN